MPGYSGVIPSGSRDTLAGPADVSSQFGYRILCPVFDTRKPSGAFEGGNFMDGEPRDFDPYAVPGKVAVLNLPKLPVYLFEKDYRYSMGDFGSGGAPESGTNWTRLVARVKPFINRRVSLGEFLRDIIVFVRRNEIVGSPSARRFITEVRSSSTSIDTRTSEAYFVVPPSYRADDRSFVDGLAQEVFGTKQLLEKRLRRGEG